MSRSRWLSLAVLGLSVSLLAAVWTSSPGYMDADYYFATAEELSSGNGFMEPFLWNYLDDPDGLPHPSHLYWMPLSSIIAAIPMRLLGAGFRAAQLPFVLLTASLPLLAAQIALHLGSDQRKAWLAGLFACSSGFYLPYLVTTETFSVYAVVGGLALWAMAVAAESPGPGRWLLAGGLLGLAHLARADGIVLVVPAMLAVWNGRCKRVQAAALVLVGYGLTMAPWWGRNVLLFGTVFPPGASRALWLVSYDELYSYPASILTAQHWWDAGLPALFQARLHALAANLQSLLAVNGIVFLSPLMMIGAIRNWKRPLVHLSMLYLGLLFVLMTFVLPQVGERGGFFHSSAALMPLLWALAAQGLEVAIDWAGKRRRWDLHRSRPFFSAGAVLLGLALTAILYRGRVVGSDPARIAWSASWSTYQQVGQRLSELDPDVDVVAVNNPPGFHSATDIQAIVIPNGTPDVLREVAYRYAADWIVLEENHPSGLDDLYSRPIDLEWLELVETILDNNGPAIHLMRVLPNEARP